MRQPVKPKPLDVDETNRVLRIYDWLAGALGNGDRGFVSTDTVLIVAERIAARTVTNDREGAA